MNDRERFPPLPECIRDEFQQLSIDLSMTRGKWILFRQLYSHSDKRADLLMRTASAFFEYVFHVFRDDTFMALHRFMDSPSGWGQENLSLRRVLERLREGPAPASLVGRLEELLLRFEEQCEPFRAHRHKRLAHRDLRVALDLAAEPLPGITLQMIDDALATAGEFLNTVQSHFCNSETAYEFLGMVGDADSLATYLVEALRYEELQRDAVVDWSDLDKSEWRGAIGTSN